MTDGSCQRHFYHHAGQELSCGMRTIVELIESSVVNDSLQAQILVINVQLQSCLTRTHEKSLVEDAEHVCCKIENVWDYQTCRPSFGHWLTLDRAVLPT